MTKVIYKDGDLFTTDAHAIGHGVNVYGVMGHGIAPEFKKRWPHMYDLYKEECLSERLQPGSTMAYVTQTGHIVFNIASQDKPGPNAQLDWLIAGLHLAMNACQTSNIEKLALPRIGCGIGGLDWDEVKPALEKIASEYSTDIEVWTL